MPDEIEAELAAIEQELDAIGAKERVYRPEDIARAGATISLGSDGTLRVERDYLRPEDEGRPEAASGQDDEETTGQDSGDTGLGDEATGGAWTSGDRSPKAPEPKALALSAALESELEAHRTAGLQAELARWPELAVRVLLHGLATDAFYGRYGETVATFLAYPLPSPPPAPALAIARRVRCWTRPRPTCVASSLASMPNYGVATDPGHAGAADAAGRVRRALR